MTRATVQALLDNIEILEHFAKGGALKYKSKDCHGEYHILETNSITAGYIENYIIPTKDEILDDCSKKQRCVCCKSCPYGLK